MYYYFRFFANLSDSTTIQQREKEIINLQVEVQNKVVLDFCKNKSEAKQNHFVGCNILKSGSMALEWVSTLSSMAWHGMSIYKQLYQICLQGERIRYS